MKFTVAATITILFSVLAQSQAELKFNQEIIDIKDHEWKSEDLPPQLSDEIKSGLWSEDIDYHPGNSLEIGKESTGSHLVIKKSQEKPGYCDIYCSSLEGQHYLLKLGFYPEVWLHKEVLPTETHRLPDSFYKISHKKNPQLPKS
jgi:hypothetical protein